MRGLELMLVLAVSVLPTLFKSTYVAFFGINPGFFKPLLFIGGSLQEISAIGLLTYVLYRSGRTLRDIGLKYRWKDLGHGILLIAVAWGACYAFMVILWLAVYKATGQRLDWHPHNVAFLGHLKGAALLFGVMYSVTSPCFEELIVRAYVQTEVTFLAASPIAAIIASVVLQVSYHFYQGWLFAISYIPLFFIFAIYYQRTGRVAPLILAHMTFDLSALLLMR